MIIFEVEELTEFNWLIKSYSGKRFIILIVFFDKLNLSLNKGAEFC